MKFDQVKIPFIQFPTTYFVFPLLGVVEAEVLPSFFGFQSKLRQVHLKCDWF